MKIVNEVNTHFDLNYFNTHFDLYSKLSDQYFVFCRFFGSKRALMPLHVYLKDIMVNQIMMANDRISRVMI